ncbi:MAG TPA: alpha/beta-hydrolase family protein, partial [Actinomycetota bacterium]|nr:alpha/beta-hydrolase family protein [Actinomycetota bacterium]
MPRTTRDQGVVTGLATAAHYGIAAVIQGSIEEVARRVAGRRADDERPARERRAVLIGDLAAMAAGFAAERALRRRDGEALARGALRTAAHWLGVVAFSGLAVGLVEEAAGGEVPLVGLPAGTAMASGLAFRRRRREQAQPGATAEASHVSGAKALGIGLGVGATAAGMALVEGRLAAAAGRAFGSVLPGDERTWRLAGHAWALSALGIPAAVLVHRWYGRIEAGAERVEEAFDTPPASGLVSGGPGSPVGWATLGRQGRRNVSTAVRPAWIEAVMGEPAVAEPIRVYVGLDSAPTEQERVDLAMRELERAGAFDRDLLLVVTPTGTGYVAYVVVESAEYLSKGSVASVALQYSLRPSVLSVDRVGVGRRQTRLLLERLRDRLGTSGRRPRVALYGESLGALAAQGAFEGRGAAGPAELGVDRALWAGTPGFARWREEVAPGGSPVDPAVGVFDRFEQVEALEPKARSRLRFVFLTHDEDPVAKFGLELLVRAPDWLGPPATRPPGVPRSETWQTPTTFLQTLVDMKNSVDLAPGHFDARGHDYRGEAARFVREVFALPATDGQLAAVEAALRRFETARAVRIRGTDHTA